MALRSKREDIFYTHVIIFFIFHHFSNWIVISELAEKNMIYYSSASFFFGGEGKECHEIQNSQSLKARNNVFQ